MCSYNVFPNLRAIREIGALRSSVLWSIWNSRTQTEIHMCIIYTMYRALRLLLLTYDPQVFNYATFEFIHDSGDDKYSRWNLMTQLFGTYHRRVGKDSSVGTGTRYGLDGAGIESRSGPDFPHPSKPVLGPTQLPVRWVPGLSRP